ncbi:hypothetical protein L6164_029465 [Bauhinia variegata]|uniref:Uncharacterized protein n=1 Tax=Bauhinia variegata TaxID=167791 RepID=A0ACB9L9V8_BAUVA|nr:hypothetical protein L6164_029465 [Bauhinia variegata]
MASSDDEMDAQPQSVSNYHFVDDRGPVSFAVLPVQWAQSESPDEKKEQVFMDGLIDGGLQKIYLEVIAWKFDITCARPEISVLLKDRRWIKLDKPRKCFQDTIRTILITVHFLHCVRKTPQASAKSVWDNLGRIFGSYEVRPSGNDLLNHIPLIREAANRDAVLAKSKLLRMVLEENSGNKQLSDVEVRSLARPTFIVDDIYDDTTYEAAEESDGDDDLFDSVCAICDNGGNLLCCDGLCMRSFHATVEEGEESGCESLGFTQKEVDEIQNFFCKNCEYKQHQCFACGKLGSSDKFSGIEVFRCNSATCGRFYHPHCVAKLLHCEDEDAAQELQKRIAGGDDFTCPIHKCRVCKRPENKEIHELQFAVCRRCPKSYHRKCLPREIAFEDNDGDDITRAWEGLLSHNRILIYCLEHKIDDELETPLRDHIKFPNVKSSGRENNATTEENTTPAAKERVISSKKGVGLDDSFSKRNTPKLVKVTEKSSSEKLGTKRKSEKMTSGSNISKKPKAKEISRNCLSEIKRPVSKVIDKPDDEGNLSLGGRLYELMTKRTEQIKPVKQADIAAVTEKELSSGLPPLDADSERRLLALFKEAASSITLENVLEKHKVASTHSHSLKTTVEKTITVGKLEVSVDAVRTALRKLENGGSTEDAEAVCGPDVLKQIFKWKDKLMVYLAPVLNGNRYTSYGRHFTSSEKLEGIVDRLHWYVQNGDMIVDFSCGSNDFSILLNKKLEETGKKCSYKNYDLLPTKNDFNFVMRDWMSVHPNELPTGSKLIMGLNPPFGVKAGLANKFIEKALEFKPKLLILIVPPETQRLDEKHSPYDLIWEDDTFLSGKSFYLPGSVDVKDKQIEQWNVRPPVLYLWSRPDFTSKHKAVAQQHGHLSNPQEVLEMETFDAETSPPKKQVVNGMCNGSPHHSKQKTVAQEHNDSSNQHEVLEMEISLAEPSPPKKQALNDRYEGAPHRSKSGADGRSPTEGFGSNSVRSSPHVEVGNAGYQHFETTHRRSSVACSRNLGQQHDNVGYRSYLSEEQKYWMESNMRSQVPYGHQVPEPIRNNYLPGHHEPAYGHMGYNNYQQFGSVPQSSYPSAIQRYAPCLDELNHVRMGRTEPIVNTSGFFQHTMPGPAYGGGPMGFASGPRPHSRHNSAGWLNE